MREITVKLSSKKQREKHTNVFIVSFQVFINLSNKGVDEDAFKSISKSFLVFDGRLVIDTSFQTRDPAICAAGPLTKFAPRYYTDEWSHANFNSKEVGQELAAMFLSPFCPTQEARDEPVGMDRLTPVYKQPKVQGLNASYGLVWILWR